MVLRRIVPSSASSVMHIVTFEAWVMKDALGQQLPPRKASAVDPVLKGKEKLLIQTKVSLHSDLGLYFKGYLAMFRVLLCSG